MLNRWQHYMTPVRHLKIQGKQGATLVDAQDLESMSINIRVATCPSSFFFPKCPVLPMCPVWGQPSLLSFCIMYHFSTDDDMHVCVCECLWLEDKHLCLSVCVCTSRPSKVLQWFRSWQTIMHWPSLFRSFPNYRSACEVSGSGGESGCSIIVTKDRREASVMRKSGICT